MSMLFRKKPPLKLEDILKCIKSNDPKALQQLLKSYPTETIKALCEQNANEIFAFATKQPLSKKDPRFQILKILLDKSGLENKYSMISNPLWFKLIEQGKQINNSTVFEPEKLWMMTNAIIFAQKFEPLPAAVFPVFLQPPTKSAAFNIGFGILSDYIAPDKDGTALETRSEPNYQKMVEIYTNINDLVDIAIKKGCPIAAKDVIGTFGNLLSTKSSLEEDEAKIQEQYNGNREDAAIDKFCARAQLITESVESKNPELKDKLKENFIKNDLLFKSLQILGNASGLKVDKKLVEKIKLLNEGKRLILEKKQSQGIQDSDAEKAIKARTVLIETLEIMLAQETSPSPALAASNPIPASPTPKSNVSLDAETIFRLAIGIAIDQGDSTLKWGKEKTVEKWDATCQKKIKEVDAALSNPNLTKEQRTKMENELIKFLSHNSGLGIKRSDASYNKIDVGCVNHTKLDAAIKKGIANGTETAKKNPSSRFSSLFKFNSSKSEKHEQETNTNTDDSTPTLPQL